jgi:hypothetical protein
MTSPVMDLDSLGGELSAAVLVQKSESQLDNHGLNC